MGRATVKLRLIALLAFLALAATACPSGGPSPPATPTTPPTATATPSPTVTPSPSPTPEPLTIPTPPDRDLFDLAVRFGRIPAGTPRTARDQPFSYSEGDTEMFVVLDPQTPAYSSIDAVMLRASEHAYFFFQSGTAVDPQALEDAARDFDTLIYPTVTGLFGRERSPGVDADPRITILHANLLGFGGYVSGADAFPSSISPRSNQREMIYIEVAMPLGSGQYNAILAHELQHLVHDNADPGEEVWVNEGLSQVALEAISPEAGAIAAFLRDPDLQLNDWGLLGEDTTPHYGASQLFFRYLLDRFGGRQNVSKLVSEAADGIAGIDAYLRPFNASFHSVFTDWLVANYLNLDSGPYAHQGSLPTTVRTTTLSALGQGQDTVAQFAADYYRIELPDNPAVFRFDGADTVPALAVAPHSGRAFWWSNRGDSIDSRLTRRFDLTEVKTATLRFWTWYETEESWDFAYVAVSSDGGRTWQALSGNHTTTYDPLGQAYGPGYTGSSTASGQAAAREPTWLEESIDLTPFAGQEVLIRFEYITDDAANLRGFALDDIAIPEIGFFDDTEAAGDWQAEGFLRLDRPLPQRFIVQLIDTASGQVQPVALDGENRAQLPIAGPVTVVIAAATDVTRERASYDWQLAAP